jgi:ketosteroid isomerase-like protein
MNSTVYEPITMLAGDELAAFTLLVQDYCASWSTRTGQPDFEQAGRFYARDPEIVYYDNGLPRDGHQGWENLKAGLLTNVYPNIASLEWIPWDVWAQCRGNLAWTGFNWRITAVAKDGSVDEREGRMTILWEQRDGVWLIVHEHSSVPYDPSK